VKILRKINGANTETKVVYKNVTKIDVVCKKSVEKKIRNGLMDTNPPPADVETAYAATGDHHIFLLTMNAVLLPPSKEGSAVCAPGSLLWSSSF
jgi:hypothetical protein